MNELQSFVNQYGLGISKRDLITKAYRQFKAEGHDCYIINDKYIGIDEKEYQLVKSNKGHRWIVKEF